jgi:Tfp pilus assembly protein PilN
MRFDINLATQPYEDARRFYTNWIIALTALVVLCALLIGIDFNVWRSTRKIADATARIRTEIATFDQEKSTAEAIVNRPENRDVRDKSRFINGLIARKSFSWTEVFSELEKVVPSHLHVVTLKPEFTKDGQLQLKLTVIADDHNAGLELLRRLEKSDHFQNPQITLESNETQSGTAGTTRPGVRVDISALYVPHLPPPAPATEAKR